MITQEWKDLYRTLVQAGEIFTIDVTHFGPVPNYTDKGCTALMIKYLADNTDILEDIAGDLISGKFLTAYEWLMHLPLSELSDADHFMIDMLRSHCADYPAMHDKYLADRAQGDRERQDFDDECDRMRG